MPQVAESVETDPLEHADLLIEIARALVDRPEKVEVIEKKPNGSRTTVLILRVAEADRGKVIGKGGATINHIRGVFSRIGAIDNCRLTIEVEDGTKHHKRARRRL